MRFQLIRRANFRSGEADPVPRYRPISLIRKYFLTMVRLQNRVRKSRKAPPFAQSPALPPLLALTQGKLPTLLYLARFQCQCYIVWMIGLLFWLLTAVIAVSIGGSLVTAYRRRSEERREALHLEMKRLETQRNKKRKDRERW